MVPFQFPGDGELSDVVSATEVIFYTFLVSELYKKSFQIFGFFLAGPFHRTGLQEVGGFSYIKMNWHQRTRHQIGRFKQIHRGDGRRELQPS